MYNAEHDDDQMISFAAALTSTHGEWAVHRLSDECVWDLRRFRHELAGIRTEGPSFGMVCVDDDWFLLVRRSPRGTSYLISDATAAVVDDMARDVLDELDLDVPDLTPEERTEAMPEAEGDFDILADLGVSEEIMAVICDDRDLWASEQLMRIAEELGADEALAFATGLE